MKRIKLAVLPATFLTAAVMLGGCVGIEPDEQADGWVTESDEQAQYAEVDRLALLEGDMSIDTVEDESRFFIQQTYYDVLERAPDTENTGVVPCDEQDEADDTASSASMEMSRTTADSTEARATAELASCDYLWDCPRCINGSWRNVLHEICSDGSDTIIHRGPCGEPCF